LVYKLEERYIDFKLSPNAIILAFSIHNFQNILTLFELPVHKFYISGAWVKKGQCHFVVKMIYMAIHVVKIIIIIFVGFEKYNMLLEK